MYLQARLDRSKVRPNISWLIDRRDYNFGSLGVLIQGLGEFPDEGELYAVLFSWPNQSNLAKMEDIWFRPALREFLRDPRFIQVMSRTPLLHYWRGTNNWPDFCFERDLPYDCKKEWLD